jgi:DNA helicase IV
MTFKLPLWSDLSDVQKRIYNRSLEDVLVQQGSPGTGKSVLALYRAVEYAMQGKQVLFLAFNKNLIAYIKSAIGSLLTQKKYSELDLENMIEIRTYYSFFFKYFHQYSVEKDSYDFDWPKLFENINEGNERFPFHYIIVDEAQDLPPVIIDILKASGAVCSIFVDENQKIDDASGTTAIDYLDTFDIENSEFLDTNYRNSKQIFELAKIFYRGNIEELAVVNRDSRYQPTLFQSSNQIALVNRIINNSPEKTVGIIAPSKVLVDSIKDELESPVEFYLTNQNFSIDFNSDKPKIFTQNTAKGLEFDIVIIVNLDEWDVSNDKGMNRLYVAITRASTELYILYEHENAVTKQIEEYEQFQKNQIVKWDSENSLRGDTGTDVSNSVSWDSFSSEVDFDSGFSDFTGNMTPDSK